MADYVARTVPPGDIASVSVTVTLRDGTVGQAFLRDVSTVRFEAWGTGARWPAQRVTLVGDCTLLALPEG